MRYIFQSADWQILSTIESKVTSAGGASVKDMPGAPLLDDVEFEDRPDSGETESGEADVVDIEPEPLAVSKAMADGPT